jgi:aromatic-L-amino-acid decarboxylase
MSDMPPEEFRRAGYAVIDWIADYLANVRELPVLPKVKPGELTASLPPSAPDKAEDLTSILTDFERLIVPANTHWNHPNFHAYFSVSSSGPGILAEALTAALNVNGMLWKSSPAATELEQVTTSWLRQWVGVPENFFGVIFDTASTSTMHALAAARELADPESRVRGAKGELVVYTSEQAHSSVEKGAIAIGIGQQNVRKIATDEQFRMRTDKLAEAMEADAAAGRKPFCVVPTIGTTSTTAIDPVNAIIAVAKRHDVWIHVDAAYGGAAAVVPEFQHIMSGVELADSFVINPHKWMFTPVDLSILYTRRPEILRRAFSLVPEYLKTAEDGRAVNYMDYGVPLGRRFRSLKLWFVMRYFGRHRVADIIRSHIHWARQLASDIAADQRFEICAPTPLSLVCFRLRGSDEENRILLDAVNVSGAAFLSHTVLNGRFVIRLAIGNVKATWGDVQRTWNTIQAEAARLDARSGR